MADKKSPTICAALIVKNEEAMLARCLDSLKGVDEIVIADTGSKDSTVEIARKYTDKVYTEYEWEDSFAKARNFVKGKVPKEYDWILSIDADEVLNESVEEVRKVLAGVGEEYSRVLITLIGENSNDTHYFPRIFRNDEGVHWGGDAHNYVEDSKGRKQFNAKDMISTTYGYSPAHQLDPERTLRILKKAVKEDPELVRERFYLAREYYYKKEWANAIKEYDEYIKRSGYLAEKNDAYLMRARCFAELGKYNEACDSAWEAIKYNTHFKEAIEFIADHMDEGNAKRWREFAQGATNQGVLFVREKQVEQDFIVGQDNRLRPVGEDSMLPMDLNKDGLFYFENLLQRKDKIDVLEWGTGKGTKYFTELLDNAGVDYTWTGMEHDERWYEQVKQWCGKNKRVKLVLADKDSEEYLKPEGKFDLIYVDGRNRVKCLQHAKSILNPGGVVLLHDAQRTRYSEGFRGYDWRFIGVEDPLLWHGQLGKMDTIPEIIHQIWIGEKERPEKWMRTWREMNPEFEYKLWTEKEIDDLNLDNRQLYDMYYEEKDYAGCSDIARAQILRDYGGVYIDADMKCTQTIKNAPFMSWDFMTIRAEDGDLRLNNSPLGCIKGHEYLVELVNRQGKVEEFYPSYEKVGPGLLTEVVDENDHRILPAYSFAPVFHRGYINQERGINYAEHYWGSTEELLLGAKGAKSYKEGVDK